MLNLDFFTLGNTITSALVLCVVVLSLMTYKRRRGLPPGPTCFPILGTVGHMTSLREPGKMKELRKKYGDVFTLMFAQSPLIVVSGAEALRELVVKNADALSDRPHSSQLQLISNGYGLVGSSGQLWKDQRSFALKTLRSFGFGKRSLENQILEEVDVFLQEVAKNDEKPFNMRELLSTSISNIICSIVFGRRFDHSDKNLQIVLNLVNQNFTSTNRLRLLGNMLPWLRHLPGDITGLNRTMKNVSGVFDFLKVQIDEHRQTFDESNIRDYIDAFLYEQNQASKNNNNNNNKNNTTFSDEQLIQSLRDLFVAGSETTATTLRWAILFLITNQDVQKRLRQEIDDIIGQFNIPSLEQKTKLPYCEAFIAEVQRLGNIAPFAVPHGVRYDVTWRGHLIPKGATVMLNLESVGMDPETFPNPEKFNPERFLENGKFIGQNKFMPFSLGRRVCLGESLARMEIFLFVISLVQRFELLPEGSQSDPSLQPVRGATRSPHPYKLRAVERN